MVLYIDPGTGSMLFSILIALATTAVFGARVVWMKLHFVLTRGKKEKADARNRGIVIYTDDKRYWNVFGPVCREADKRSVPLVYMTQSEDDPALKEHFDNIKTEFISEGNKGIAKMNFLVADIVLSTTPNLDVYQWKRSREVKWYVHVPHAIPDMLTYRMFALDFYDTVLLTGDFQGTYIRRAEKMRGEAEHELVTVGYPPLDEQAQRLKLLPPVDNKDGVTVLFAPSWGKSGMLSRHGAQLIQNLISTGYHIVVRPHPQTVKTEQDILEPLIKKFPSSDALEWNYDNDNFECMRHSDILVGDFSGIMFEYAVMLDKPVIYAKTAFDSGIYDAAWFEGEEIWRFSALRKIGTEFHAEDIPHIKDVIDRTIKNETLRIGRQEVRDETWTHRGQAAVNIVDYLVKKQKELLVGGATGAEEKKAV